MENYYELFGQKIKEIRHEKKWTLSLMGEKTGISPGYLTDIENARGACPSKEKVDKIVKAFGLLKLEKKYDLYYLYLNMILSDDILSLMVRTKEEVFTIEK